MQIRDLSGYPTPSHLQLHITQQVLQAPRDVLGGLGNGLLTALRQPEVLHLQAQATPICRQDTS